MSDMNPIATMAAALALAAAAPATAQVLRLDADEAARMAIEASTLVEAAEARLEATLAGAEVADAARLPMVSAGASIGRQSSVPELAVPIYGLEQPPVPLFPSIETTWAAQLEVQQLLYSGGAINGGREAARLEVEAADLAREITAAELRLAARVAYWGAVAASAGLDAARSQEERAGRLLVDAQALRDAGMAVDADVLAARAGAEAARLGVIQAETGSGQALASLRSLVGVSRTVSVELQDVSGTALPPLPAELESLVGEAVENRPELRSADAAIAALGARERVARAASRPVVSLAGQWQLARPNLRFLPLEDRWNDSWSVAVVAGWTLFDGDRTQAEAAVVRARRSSALAERAEAERRASLEVELARLDLVAALEAAEPAEAAQAAAEAREQASRERYQAGLAPMVETLDAQVQLRQAELAVIRARSSAWVAAAALERAVGR